MRQTEEYKLNLLDGEDKLSPKPLNENMEKVEAALAALSSSYVAEVSKRLMMARGSYVGTGTGAVSIETPGFTPVAMAVWVRDPAARYSVNVEYPHKDPNPASFWGGENIKGTTTASYSADGYAFTDAATVNFTIEFTPRSGGLSWETKPGDLTGMNTWRVPAGYAFDLANTTYCWVAFGYAEVDYGEA